VLAQGRGEALSPSPTFAPLDAVLVNPGVASPTGAVYRAFDEMGGQGDALRPPLPAHFESAEALAAVMGGLRNDLAAPAIALNPVIGEAIDLLDSAPESLLSRVSGSGATCFALCASPAASLSLAARITARRPDWWVRSCRLGGPWPDGI
jgi:4-diphosphocytidyl-2-C-methyl-D-erythritol kinase